MFLEDIQILSVDICVQDKTRFTAQTRASADLTRVLPYLNAMLRRADYNPNAGSIKFVQEGVEFTVMQNQINLQKFRTRTEMMELLDWAQELINDVYDSMHELTPRHTTRKIPPALTIYSMLPKTNCRKCGEQSCMAFASRLFRMEAELDACPLLGEIEYKKLEQAFE